MLFKSNHLDKWICYFLRQERLFSQLSQQQEGTEVRQRRNVEAQNQGSSNEEKCVTQWFYQLVTYTLPCQYSIFRIQSNQTHLFIHPLFHPSIHPSSQPASQLALIFSVIQAIFIKIPLYFYMGYKTEQDHLCFYESYGQECRQKIVTKCVCN